MNKINLNDLDYPQDIFLEEDGLYIDDENGNSVQVIVNEWSYKLFVVKREQ